MGKPRFIEAIITKRIYRRKIRNLRTAADLADKAGDLYASVTCRAFAAELADFLKRCYNYEV